MRESQKHNRMTQAVATEEDISSAVEELLLSFCDIAEAARQVYGGGQRDDVHSDHRRRKCGVAQDDERSFESPRLPDSRPAEAKGPLQPRDVSHCSVRNDYRHHLEKLEPERKRESGASASPQQDTGNYRQHHHGNPEHDLQWADIGVVSQCFERQRDQSPDSKKDLDKRQQSVEHTGNLTLTQQSTLADY